MTILTVSGYLSLMFIVAFTFKVYYSSPTPGQTPRGSIVEAWINLIVGFTVNFLANYAILPLVGAHFTLNENFLLGLDYTAISIARQFVIRRWFNSRLHSLSIRLAGTK